MPLSLLPPLLYLFSLFSPRKEVESAEEVEDEDDGDGEGARDGGKKRENEEKLIRGGRRKRGE